MEHDARFKEIDKARENLLRALRGIGAHEDILQAIERFVDAKINAPKW